MFAGEIAFRFARFFVARRLQRGLHKPNQILTNATLRNSCSAGSNSWTAGAMLPLGVGRGAAYALKAAAGLPHSDRTSPSCVLRTL